MSSATPSETPSASESHDQRWDEYHRAITLALRAKKDDSAQPAPAPLTDNRSEVLRAIDHISTTVGRSLADARIVQQLCAAIRATLAIDFSYTIGFDPKTQTCHTLGGDELDPSKLGELFDAKYTRLRFLESLPSLASGETAEIDVATATAPLADLYRRLGFQRVMHVPLTRGNELSGIQLVGRRTTNLPFPEEARAILHGIAPTAALALEVDRTRRQLERSEQVSRYLAANISHELRNTFSVIIGYGEILRDEARQGAGLEGKNGAMVERLYSAACEGLEILRPAFELSNPLHDHTPLEIEDVDIGDLLYDIVNERFCDQRPEVGLSNDVAPDLPVVRTDRMKLRMIVEQVVSNAQKFTTEGEISLSATQATAGDVRITVADTGPGIPDDRLAVIFDALSEPAFEAPREKTGGLGLYLAKQLADRLGATLEVESTLGEGTTVRVTLPSAPPA